MMNKEQQLKSIQDLQDRAIEGQDLQDLVSETAQRLELTSLGYIVLYHGTNEKSAEKIQETGIFNDGSFFAASKAATLPHVKPKFGSNVSVIRIEVDPRDVEFSTGTGEFYSPDVLKKSEGGKWMSEERLLKEQSIQNALISPFIKSNSPNL